MATKWIKVPVTLHVPGKAYKPIKYDNNGGALEGVYDIVEVPPMTPVEMEEAEADKLLGRYEAQGAVVATAEEIAAAKKPKGGKTAGAAPQPASAPGSDPAAGDPAQT